MLMYSVFAVSTCATSGDDSVKKIIERSTTNRWGRRDNMKETYSASNRKEIKLEGKTEGSWKFVLSCDLATSMEKAGKKGRVKRHRRGKDWACAKNQVSLLNGRVSVSWDTTFRHEKCESLEWKHLVRRATEVIWNLNDSIFYSKTDWHELFADVNWANFAISNKSKLKRDPSRKQRRRPLLWTSKIKAESSPLLPMKFQSFFDNPSLFLVQIHLAQS